MSVQDLLKPLISIPFYPQKTTSQAVEFKKNPKLHSFTFLYVLMIS